MPRSTTKLKSAPIIHYIRITLHWSAPLQSWFLHGSDCLCVLCVPGCPSLLLSVKFRNNWQIGYKSLTAKAIFNQVFLFWVQSIYRVKHWINGHYSSLNRRSVFCLFSCLFSQSFTAVGSLCSQWTQSDLLTWAPNFFRFALQLFKALPHPV